MNVHGHARPRPTDREPMVRQALAGEARLLIAERHGVSVRTAAKWLARFQEEGTGGLRDGSSRPHRPPRRTNDEVAARILALRRRRRTAPIATGRRLH